VPTETPERAGEVGGAPLIPRDESAIVLEPGKEPFDSQAALCIDGVRVDLELDRIRFLTVRARRLRHRIDRPVVEAVAVIGRVADGSVGFSARQLASRVPETATHRKHSSRRCRFTVTEHLAARRQDLAAPAS